MKKRTDYTYYLLLLLIGSTFFIPFCSKNKEQNFDRYDVNSHDGIDTVRIDTLDRSAAIKFLDSLAKLKEGERIEREKENKTKKPIIL